MSEYVGAYYPGSRLSQNVNTGYTLDAGHVALAFHEVEKVRAWTDRKKQRNRCTNCSFACLRAPTHALAQTCAPNAHTRTCASALVGYTRPRDSLRRRRSSYQLC